MCENFSTCSKCTNDCLEMKLQENGLRRYTNLVQSISSYDDTIVEGRKFSTAMLGAQTSRIIDQAGKDKPEQKAWDVREHPDGQRPWAGSIPTDDYRKNDL